MAHTKRRMVTMVEQFVDFGRQDREIRRSERVESLRSAARGGAGISPGVMRFARVTTRMPNVGRCSHEPRWDSTDLPATFMAQSDIPMHQIPALVAEVASEQATLSALQGVLTTRLLASQAAGAPTPPELSDRLLTADEVAIALGVTKRWVQRRARRLPFARQLSAHAVRYSESGLKRWMANRHMRVA